MENSYRIARVVHLAMFAAAFVYIFLAEQLANAATAPLDLVLLMSFTGVAFAIAVAALIIRKMMIVSSAVALPSDPYNVALQNRWRVGTIIVTAMGESIVLFGFVLRILGAQRTERALLYLLGIAVLLLATPRKPKIETPGV